MYVNQYLTSISRRPARFRIRDSRVAIAHKSRKHAINGIPELVLIKRFFLTAQ